MFPLKYLKLICILCCYFSAILFSIRSTGQTHRVDSLRLLTSNTSKEVRKNAYLKLCEQNYSLSGDSIAQYVKQGIVLCNANEPALYQFKTYYSMYFLKMDKSKEAVHYLDSLLQGYLKTNKPDKISREISFYLSVSQVRNNQYKEAIQTALKILDEVENTNDTIAILRTFNVIGWANMELENEQEATKWLFKGIQLTSNPIILQQTSALYTNMASCYNVLRNYDSALYFVNKGIELGNASENLTILANGLNIRAAIHSHLKNEQLAVQDLEQALKIRKKIGDLYYIISDMALLSHYYAYIGHPEKGIPIAKQGIELAQQSGNSYKLIYLQKGLANNYEAAGMHKERAEVLVNVLHLKDSLYEKNTEDAIADIKTKYEVQKKENIIIQQQHALVKNRYFTIGALLIILLGSMIVWLSYRNIKHIQKQKVEQLLAQEKMHSLVAVQQAEENERKRIAADLHDNLGSYAAAISSNIRYLKEKDPNQDQVLINQLDENAQGIVTQLSDTIWILKNEHLPVTKLADRFKAWVQKLITNYPSITYHYNEQIEQDIELTPATILNIFLILKESLNNCLKHSGCKTIRIEIISTNFLSFSITDDGIGLSKTSKHEGLGLKNMEYRAKACDFNIEWQSVTPNGTKVVLTNRTTN